MKPTQQMIDDIRQWTAAREYEVWQIQLAAKTNNTFSEYHPDNLRAQIRRLRGLLNEAL
jgi:hypothetical protein